MESTSTTRVHEDMAAPTGRLRAVLAVWVMLVALALSSRAMADEPDAADGDGGEHISFVIDHADTSKGPVEGSFSGYELTSAHVDLDDLDASYAVYEIDLSTIATGNIRRDAHLRSDDFFHVDQFPKATLAPEESGAADALSVEVRLHLEDRQPAPEEAKTKKKTDG